MRVGEVCLLTHDVAALASFYRRLLGLDGSCDDPVHQTLLSEETMLTVLKNSDERPSGRQRICLAFTVPDVDMAYAALLRDGVEVPEPPVTRPWGARNLCLLDPDGNRVYLRSFPAQA